MPYERKFGLLLIPADKSICVTAFENFGMLVAYLSNLESIGITLKCGFKVERCEFITEAEHGR